MFKSDYYSNNEPGWKCNIGSKNEEVKQADFHYSALLFIKLSELEGESLSVDVYLRNEKADIKMHNKLKKTAAKFVEEKYGGHN